MTKNTPDFEDFWAQYPVHKDRKRAEQAWQRLTAGDRRAAIAALPGYIADCQQNGIQYKYAQGWLNGRRWEDEVEEPQVSSAKFQVTSKPTGDNDLKPETLKLEPEDAATPPSGIELW